MRNLDLTKEISKIEDFIRSYVHKSGLQNVVIGLSGGVDSSLSAMLAVKALGKEHVFGVMMPSDISNPESFTDALELATELDIHNECYNISPFVEAYFNNFHPSAVELRIGNWMARIRMCILFDLSAKYEALVLGTSNRSELMTGYFTQFGDGACAFEPIGHLYKTEVWKMSKQLSISETIIRKTPSADLWANQTDEGELGLKYHELDIILYALTEQHKTTELIIQEGFTEGQVQRVMDLMRKSEFKRQLPPLITG